jgi:nitrite reductase/ring-hydroxylating ferredoxin subunit
MSHQTCRASSTGIHPPIHPSIGPPANLTAAPPAAAPPAARRLAPLSEGRIEADGSLQCAYHGWQFDGRGACTHIPQLRSDDRAQQTACASRRACVRAFPTQVVHGLLWVLPDSSPLAHEEVGTGGGGLRVASSGVR